MEHKFFKESSHVNDYVIVSRNKTINTTKEGNYGGRIDSIEFRREYVDIKEEDIISIPVNEIPDLISYLEKLIDET